MWLTTHSLSCTGNRFVAVDSDASSSSFYFRSSLIHPYNRNQRRPDSGISIGPPISLFNHNSTCRRRGDSTASVNSVAPSYINCRPFSWNPQRTDFSVELVISDFSGANLGRPGLGDKMLDSAQERASPPSSLAGSLRGERTLEEKRPSYDSIIDGQYQTQKTNSLFEKTGRRNSVCSSDSMFFEDHPKNVAVKPPQYHPISSLSIPSMHSLPKEDDTMTSILGSGHVHRRPVTSMIGGSPRIQAERRKNVLSNPPEVVFDRIKNTQPVVGYKSLKTTPVVESKPSIASTNLFKFGDEHMICARHGLLKRQNLDNAVLMGDGEDLPGSVRMPVFSWSNRANRSRSSTCTSSCSGAETPPLSVSDDYSLISEGSLSSIDLSQLNTLLSNSTHPLSNATLERACPSHTRGHGHRQCIPQAHASRTSIYETIHEELSSPLFPECSVLDSTSDTPKLSQTATKPMEHPVFVVDSETSSVDSFSLWSAPRLPVNLPRREPA
ncbi:hypothetical protein J3R83DRAFT_5466 [Lanmaoa asiatica]|nr:hypothetical protein J3R83DRAFT_5466 [Lanmaoa asiatica]